MSYGAAEIEHNLVIFLTQIPKVREIVVIREKDYLFSFAHFGAISTPCVLEFRRNRIVIAYSGGQGYPLPEDVREHIGICFPESRYINETGPGKDGFHFWYGISPEDIRESIYLNMAP